MKYILYCRKSTEDKKHQALSLPAQKRELLDLAEKNGLNVVKIYSESRSAKNVGRPEFANVMRDLRSGKADGILCWKLDRLARNFIDGGDIIHSLQNNVIKEIVTFQKTYYPSDSVYEMAIEFGSSNQYSRDLSVNVKRGNRQKLKQGGWPSMAPIGYLNDRINKTIVVDKERAPFVKKAFEMHSLGSYSLREIADKLYKEGFRTKSGKAEGKKVHKSKIHVILNNPFYYGLMKQQGKLFPGNHEPLISKDLFDKCQLVSGNRSKPRPKKHFFIFRGLFTCHKCGCVVTAQKQRGHSYYHCTNGKQVCDQKKNYIRGQDLDNLIADKVFSDNLLEDKMLEIVYEKSLNETELDKFNNREKITFLKGKIKNIEIKKSNLADMLIEDRIEKTMYDNKLRELENELTNFKLELKNSCDYTDTTSTFEQTKKCFKSFIYGKNAYLRLDKDEKRERLFELLSNITLQDKKIVSLQYKPPFDIIAKMPKNPSFSTLSKTWNEVSNKVRENLNG